MNLYFILAIGGLLGAFGHSLKKVNEINKKYDKTDFKAVFTEYWQHEKLAFVTSIFFYGLLLFVSSELINFKQASTSDPTDSLQDKLLHFRLANFIKCVSVMGGWFADSIVYGAMGVTEKRLQKKFSDEEAALNKTPS
jgi:hypothetical protein